MTIDHPQDDRAAALLGVALRLTREIRNDLAGAHRTVGLLSRADLEALACVQAAIHRVDHPILPWWQVTPATPARVADRRKVLAEALAPRRRSA